MGLSWGQSGQNMELTTNLLLVPGCQWVGAIPLPSLCAFIGISWGDLYLHVYNILHTQKNHFNQALNVHRVFEVK